MSNENHPIHSLFDQADKSEPYSSRNFKCEEIRENDFICSECGKGFKSPHAMRSHKNWHNPEHKRKIEKSVSLSKEKTKEMMKNKYEKLLLDKITEYEKLPSTCENCSNVKPYKKRHNRFCSQSCAAYYINAKRDFSYNEKISLKLKEKYKNLSDEEKILFKENLSKNKKYLPKIVSTCIYCNDQIISTKNRTYCGSTACLKQHNVENGKKSASKRLKRSKDEITLFNLCEEQFIAYSNYIISDGWDADIVLPDQKIAILWNGPWHYREMLGLKHSLKQVQNRDRIKTELFESLGWTVLIYEDRYWTPETAFENLKGLLEK